jgi:CRP-like cAMP-binding protein
MHIAATHDRRDPQSADELHAAAPSSHLRTTHAASPENRGTRGERREKRREAHHHPDDVGSPARLAVLFDRYSATGHGVKLARQKVLYSEGQHDQNIYLIEFGQVKAVSCSPGGRSCLLSIRTAGDFVGELGLLHPCRRETVTTMKPTRLRCIPLADFRAALMDEGLVDEFLCYLLAQISDQQAVIANMVTMNSEQRLAATILELAAKLGTQRGGTTYINDRITHEELSSMVGTTRSRVGLFLKHFKTRGMIVEAGSSVVVNEDMLRRYLWDSTNS